MKYMIGLIMFFVMSATSFAQNQAMDTDKSKNGTKIYRLENGSVYYIDNPNSREAGLASENTGTESSVLLKNEVQTVGSQCSLNSMLTSRQGEFKVDRKGKDEELKIEREKDGDAVIKYDSDTEYYKYQENEKGESKYVYSIENGDEAVEVIKNKDGSGEVIYYGYFNNLDDAGIFDEGIVVGGFEGVKSVCK